MMENSEQKYLEIGEQFAKQYEVIISKMFGKPCLKTPNKKAFAAFYENKMVFKLGQEAIVLLKEKYIGSVNWDPSKKNRAMKDWIQIPSEYFDDWKELSKLALDFVESVENK